MTINKLKNRLRASFRSNTDFCNSKNLQIIAKLAIWNENKLEKGLKDTFRPNNEFANNTKTCHLGLE